MSCASATVTEDELQYFIYHDDNDDVATNGLDDLTTATTTTTAVAYKRHPKKAETQAMKALEHSSDEELFEQKLDSANLGKLVVPQNRFVQVHAAYRNDDEDDIDDKEEDDVEEPVELLALANNDVNAVETAQLLLSNENQTSNFVDFNEFNLCLNNMLNDDDVVDVNGAVAIIDPILSPSQVLSDSMGLDVEHILKVNVVEHSKLKRTTSDLISVSPCNITNHTASNTTMSSSNSSTTPNHNIDDVNDDELYQSLLHLDHHQQQQQHLGLTTFSANRFDKQNSAYSGNNANLSALSAANQSTIPINTTTNTIPQKIAKAAGGSSSMQESSRNPTPTALNVIQHNSHSIVNIFQ